VDLVNQPSRQCEPQAGGTYEIHEEDAPQKAHSIAPQDAASTTSHDLLSRVLSETLSRKHSDPELMMDALRKWRAEIPSHALDQPTFQSMISKVLDIRLGRSASELTDELRREVSDVLWENPHSRTRIERLWNSIGTV
jgi:hypothetical protein